MIETVGTNISWIDNNQVMSIDFTDPDWKSKFPDRFTVEDSEIPFYVDNTFTFEGNPTYRCGDTPDSGKSESSIIITTVDDGIIEFNYTDSSEYNYDKFIFSLDGTELFTRGNMTGWDTFTKAISKGTHKLTFAYTRDSSGVGGKNACAIGYLKFSKVAPEYKVWRLVKSKNLLYTIVNGALKKLPNKTKITSATFKQFGFFGLPDGALLKNLVNPKILEWSDSQYFSSSTNVVVTATPFPKTFESINYSLVHTSIVGIEKVIADASESVLFTVSFDNGATWVRILENNWVTVSEITSGMPPTVLNSITTEQWKEIATKQIKFRVTLLDTASKFTSLIVDYLNNVQIPTQEG